MKKFLRYLLFIAYLLLAAYGFSQLSDPFRLDFNFTVYFWVYTLAPGLLAFIGGLLLMFALGQGLFAPGPGRKRLSRANLLLALLLLILAYSPYSFYLLKNIPPPAFLYLAFFQSSLHLDQLFAFAAGITLANAFRRA